MNAGRVVVRRKVAAGDPPRLAAFLATHAALGAAAIAESLEKGAVWRTAVAGHGRGKTLRVYDDTPLRTGDRVELFHDPAILAVEAPDPAPIEDRGGYGAWFKPAGLMTQGTRYGDHASLLRKVERGRGAPAHLVHRLDREACGVLLLAYDRATAGALSRAFRDGGVEKRYVAVVVGDFGAGHGENGTIEEPLDGKPARTGFRVLAYEEARDRTWLDVTLPTGRKHQIRRHLDGIGHPVLGDPRYGRGNKNRDGLRLAAVELALRCPVRHRPARFVVPKGAVPWLDERPGAAPTGRA